jgi:RNA polymerase sigma-70 factor (ECF subfamily)
MEIATLQHGGPLGETLEACRRGERDARRALFESCADRVHAVALGFFGGDRSSASDVVQQVFLKVFTRLDGFRGTSSFPTWLHRLTVNECLDEKRRRRRLVPLEDAPGMRSATVSPPDESIARSENERRVQNALARLPEQLRLTILLKHFEDLSYEEIAEVLGCSSGTVASRLSRGHAQLARLLGKG